MVLANKKQLIGLDIGSSAVKAVCLEQKAGRYELKGSACVPVTIPEDAEVDSQNAVLMAVRECLNQVQARSGDVVCGLNGEHVILRPFRFAPLPKAEIPGAVQLEAMQVCPFGLEDAVVDYQLLNWHQGAQTSSAPETDTSQASVTGVLTVARQEAIDFKRSMVTEAGARCVLMDMDGLALLNAVHALRPGQETEENTAAPVAVLHVGHRISTLAIGAPDEAPFVRDFSFAGQDMMQLVADRIGKEVEEVTQQVQEKGSLPRTGKAVLNSVCQTFADHVNETLRYYAAQHAGSPPQALWLSGGAAALEGFVEALNQALKRVDVRLWDPVAQLDETGTSTTMPGPAFAVAVGLAMRVL